MGWLSVLQIECGHPDDWDRSFSNAYLFGKILASYTHRSSSASSAVGIFSCLKNMQTGYSSTAKQHNFILVSAVDDVSGFVLSSGRLASNIYYYNIWLLVVPSVFILI